MKPFDYVRPSRLEEAISLLEQYGGEASILSGGTDLIVQLREGRRIAKLVIDIKDIPETNELTYDSKLGLRLGASVPCHRIYGDAKIAQAYPGLMDVATLIGGTQIQGRASFGGNLCNASPAADSIPALIAHHTRCLIAGPEGRRELAIEEFCTAPGRTVLQPGELLVRFEVPPREHGFGARYLRFIPRHEMDIAVVGVGASVILDPDGTTILSARVALGAVAPTPLLVEEAGMQMQNRKVSAELIAEAARHAQAAALPISDMRGSIEQRKYLVGVLTRRALEGAIARAKSSSDPVIH